MVVPAPTPIEECMGVKFLSKQSKDLVYRPLPSAAGAWDQTTPTIEMDSWIALLVCMEWYSKSLQDPCMHASYTCITTFYQILTWLNAACTTSCSVRYNGHTGIRCIHNRERLVWLHMQKSEEETKATLETIPGQLTGRIYLHGHIWPVAKITYWQPISGSRYRLGTWSENEEEKPSREVWNISHPSSTITRPYQTGRLTTRLQKMESNLWTFASKSFATFLGWTTWNPVQNFLDDRAG